MNEALNVFNEPLIVCGTSPVTGAYRDGCCNTGANDRGTHTVCAVVTDAFLQFSKSKGNDLTMDYPPIILKATHLKTLEYISLEELMEHEYTL